MFPMVDRLNSKSHTDDYDVAQQNHWTERGRAASVAHADATGRPRRSVMPLDGASGSVFDIRQPMMVSFKFSTGGRKNEGC